MFNLRETAGHACSPVLEKSVYIKPFGHLRSIFPLTCCFDIANFPISFKVSLVAANASQTLPLITRSDVDSLLPGGIETKLRFQQLPWESE